MEEGRFTHCVYMRFHGEWLIQSNTNVTSTRNIEEDSVGPNKLDQYIYCNMIYYNSGIKNTILFYLSYTVGNPEQTG